MNIYHLIDRLEKYFIDDHVSHRQLCINVRIQLLAIEDQKELKERIDMIETECKSEDILEKFVYILKRLVEKYPSLSKVSSSWNRKFLVMKKQHDNMEKQDIAIKILSEIIKEQKKEINELYYCFRPISPDQNRKREREETLEEIHDRAMRSAKKLKIYHPEVVNIY